MDTPLTETVEIVGVDKESRAFPLLQAGFRRQAESPAEVAEIILRGMARNRYPVHTSGRVRAAHVLQRAAPPMYALAMRAMNSATHRLLRRAVAAPPADGWTDRERTLLAAVDALHRDRDLDDAGWRRMRAHLDEKAAIELLLAGHYGMLATTIAALRPQPDPPR